MRGADHGRAGRARDVGEQRAERERVGAVEPRRRLVRDERQRPRGEGARERGPLALTGGELADRPLGVLRRARPRRAPRVRQPPRPGEPRSSSAELGVLAGAEERDEPERLADEGDRAPPQLGAAGAVERRPATRRRRATSPSSGISSPASRCSSVVLPEPDGPVTTVSLPGRERRVEPLERRRRPVPLRQPARLDRLCSCNTSLARNGLVERGRGEFVLQEH